MDKSNAKKIVSMAGAKLKQARNDAGLTVRALAALADMKASSYAYYEDGYKERYLPLGVVLALQGILLSHGVSRETILELVNPNEQQVVLMRSEIIEVPILSWVSAGKPREMWADEEPTEYELVQVDRSNRRNSIALKVRGNSMDRRASDGSSIIVDRSDTELMDRKYYVVVIDDETVFKQYRADPPRLEADSVSERHDPIFMNGQDITIVGRVWKVATRL